MQTIQTIQAILDAYGITCKGKCGLLGTNLWGSSYPPIVEVVETTAWMS